MLSKLNQVSVLIFNSHSTELLKFYLQNFIIELGFDSFNLSYNKKDKIEFITNPTITSWTETDLAEYSRNGWADRDPLLHYAASEGPPLSWNLQYWAHTPQHEDYVHYLNTVGLKGGVTIPLPLPSGRLGAMTALSTSQSEFSQPCIQAMAILARIAMMQASALGLETHPTDTTQILLKTLSPLQMEILSWAAQGKSSLDIATILEKKKRGIDYHMSEILKKLNVSSRAQAIALYSDHERA